LANRHLTGKLVGVVPQKNVAAGSNESAVPARQNA
jgi:hypothetical protein